MSQVPVSASAEDLDSVTRRVRRRVSVMVASLFAIPIVYLIGLYFASRQSIGVADCLPPGIRIETPLDPATPHSDVADALAAAGAAVRNGTLIDQEGRPIAFDVDGDGTSHALANDSSKERMQKAYRVIKIRTSRPNAPAS